MYMAPHIYSIITNNYFKDLNTMLELVPPNPNELDMHACIFSLAKC